LAIPGAGAGGLGCHSELSKNATQIKLTEWPGQVISLYLGKITPESFMAAAKDADPKKDREQHCEAYFYLGEYTMITGKQEEASRLFQQSVDTGVTNFVEYR
jgi:lipoprotein NlpI